MIVLKEERDRVLQMIEGGQLTAAQAAVLLDTFDEEQDHMRESAYERDRHRVVRFQTTNLHASTQKKYMTATIPVNLIKVALRLGVRLVPQLHSQALEDLLWAIEQGAIGRVLDLQDLEKGERLEIFVQ
jgi:SHOCT-like domain